MKRIAIALVIAVAVINLAAAWLFHRNAEAKFNENELKLRDQDGQLAMLTVKQQELSNEVVEVEHSTNGQWNELASLAAEAQKLQNLTNNLRTQISSNLQARVSHSAKKAPHTQEYYDQLHQMAGAKPRDALFLGQGLMDYALDHQGHFPTDLGQVDSYLRKNKATLSGTNQFDIVFRGSLDDLKGVPTGTVAVLREQQPWTGPDGMEFRVYGMANGTAQTVESDDGFKSWEAQHVFPASASQ